MAKKPKKKNRLKNQLANYSTAASAGPGGVGFGTKSKARGTVAVGSPLDGTLRTEKAPLKKGTVAYGGRTYNARNLAGLANALNKKGVSLSRYAAKRPGLASALGVSQGRLNSFVKARLIQNKLRKKRQGRG